MVKRSYYFLADMKVSWMQKRLKRRVAKTEQLNSVPNLNRLSWDDIRVFLACAKEPSFRQAAEKVNISASTVVRRIEQLEEALGVRLFNRLPEGAELTPEARGILKSATEMEKSLFELVHQRTQTDDIANGRISVSITEGLGTYWLMPQLVDFQRQFPNLIFNVQCAMRNADVLRLEADIAIQFERPTNPELIVSKLGRLHFYPFASQKYLHTYGEPKNIKDVLQHRFVQQISSNLDEMIWAKKLGLDSIDAIPGVRTNSSAAALYAIERGAGIGVLPTYALALKAPAVPVDIGIHHSFDIWMTYHPSIKKVPRKVMILDWIKSIFDTKKYPWFRDSFIHPNELKDLVPEEASVCINDNYFTIEPFS